MDSRVRRLRLTRGATTFDVDAVTVQTADVTDLALQVQLAEAVASTTKISIQSLMTQGAYWLWASQYEGETEYEHGFVKAGTEPNRIEQSWALYDIDNAVVGRWG